MRKKVLKAQRPALRSITLKVLAGRLCAGRSDWLDGWASPLSLILSVGRLHGPTEAKFDIRQMRGKDAS